MSQLLTTLLTALRENWLEWLGVLTTIAGIVLAMLRRVINWPITLVADIVYLWVFWQARLYSDSLLQIFFILFTFYGWWNWQRGLRTEGSVRVLPIARIEWLLGIPLTACAGLLLGLIMLRLNAALPFLDAQLTAFSLLATWWQTRKYTANWPVWIVVNIIYVGEYFYKNLVPTAILYAGLVVLAAIGWIAWRKAESPSAPSIAQN